MRLPMAPRFPDRPRHAGAGRALPAVLAAAGLLLAGCGGSRKPTKAQYVAKANKECAALARSLNSIGSRQGATFQQALVESVRAKEQANKSLHAIKLPADSGVPSQWLHYRDLALTAAQELLSTRPRSAKRRTLGAQYGAATDKAEAIARSYGLTACVGPAAS
jgi:ribosomal protein L20A (L18A)